MTEESKEHELDAEAQEPSTNEPEEFWKLNQAPPADTTATSAAPPPSGAAGATAIIEPEAPGRRMSKVWVAAGIAAVAVVAGVGAAFALGSGSHKSAGVSTTNAGAAGAAASQGGRGGRGGTTGKLASVKGSTITVTTPSGQSVTVSTSSATSVTKVVSGSIADVKPGDFVIATGTPDAAGTVTATRVMDQGANAFNGRRGPGQGQGGQGQGGQGQAPGAGGPGGPAGTDGGFAAGMVKTVNGATIVITSRDGSDVSVTTTPSTAFSVTQPAKLSSLTVGQTVVVRGTTNSDGSVVATSIQQGGTGFGFGGRRNQQGGATGTGA